MLADLARRETDGLFVTKLLPAAVITAENIATGLANHGRANNINDSIKARNQLWRQKLAHANNKLVKTMLPSKKYGTVEADKQGTQNCPSCVLTKQARTKSTGKLIRHSKTAAIHADICGPMQMPSHNGNKYFLKMTAAEQRYKKVKLWRSRENGEGYSHDYIN